jgi:hypothetical protein
MRLVEENTNRCMLLSVNTCKGGKGSRALRKLYPGKFGGETNNIVEPIDIATIIVCCVALFIVL